MKSLTEGMLLGSALPWKAAQLSVMQRAGPLLLAFPICQLLVLWFLGETSNRAGTYSAVVDTLACHLLYCISQREFAGIYVRVFWLYFPLKILQSQFYTEVLNGLNFILALGSVRNPINIVGPRGLTKRQTDLNHDHRNQPI